VQLAGWRRGAAERARRDARVTRVGVMVLAVITLAVTAGGTATALARHGAAARGGRGAPPGRL
jgi:hypothetical protein